MTSSAHRPGTLSLAHRPVAVHVHGVSPGRVVLLQAIRSDPAVSILMNTRPAKQMDQQDRARLLALVEQAAARLLDPAYAGAGEALVEDLRLAAEDCAAAPMADALALFVSSGFREMITLEVLVIERVVVDPTFATRDLVRGLHRTPRHVVLVLNRGTARLFDGVGRDLRPARSGAFPMRSEGARPADFLRRVDRALGTYRALHPSPLVLVGPPDVLSTFASLSRHSDRLAGQVPANVPGAPLTELSRRIRPVIGGYLRSRQQEALELLDRRKSAGRVVSGMQAAWLAARTERPEMLIVEEGLFYPARLSADGDWLTPAGDVEHPDVVDDAVDELIEMVLDRGGWVALVEDGALTSHDRVAVTLRAAQ